MMYAIPHYYHGSQNAYVHRKTLVKQEPVDSFDAETSMDTSSVDVECPPNASIDISADHGSTSCDNVQLKRSYVAIQQSFPEHRKPHTVTKQHIPYTTSPSFEDLSSVGVHVPSSSMEDYQINFSRIKRIPEILTKSSRNYDQDSVDLSIITANQRARREFVPDDKKDNSYWSKRLKNNDSARRSRVKRKALEKILETRLMELEKENLELRHEVASLRRRYGEENRSFSGPSSSSTPVNTPLNIAPLPSPSQENTNVDGVSRDYDACAFSARDNARYQTSVTYMPTNLNPKPENVTTDRSDSINNDFQITKTFSNSQQNSCSFSDSSFISEPQTDLTGALDLTIDNSNRSTPSWESSSSESDNNSCFRRYTFTSSESSSQEDNNNTSSIKVFPLKCRWKKEIHASYTAVPERLK